MERPPLRVVNNKFVVRVKIDSGSSSEIYFGINIHTNEQVAIKIVENVNTTHPPRRPLLYEANILRILQGGFGFPNVRWFGVEGNYNVLVMDYLGFNLEHLLSFCSRKLSLKTVLMVADQLIDRVEFVHSKSLLHRDIRPKNFLLGSGRFAIQVFVTNFGLAKKFRDPSTHQHIPYRENKNFTGNTRFASVNTHLGIEQSRRDDLESLGYVLMYFVRGRLPWQGLKAETREEMFEKIREKKVQTSIETLCDGYPTEFASYFHYCRSLQFEDKPDYAYLKRIFRDLFIREGFQFDYAYDWTILMYEKFRITTPPARILGVAGKPISGVPPVIPNMDRQPGRVDGRLVGELSSVGPSRLRTSGQATNTMVSSSSFMRRSSGSWRPIGLCGSGLPVRSDSDPTAGCSRTPTVAKTSSGQISDSFICAVCRDLVYKPIILACGHISCFWCVHNSMSFCRESHCPVCQHAYQHFSAISKMLHFLLYKIYPITYKRREDQILEFERQQMKSSPDLGSSAVVDEYCGQVSVADVLCAACNQMLYRPVALNCGHLYCEVCVVTQSTEMLRCQVCECAHPGDFPKVCLVLEQFLEEQFSLEYAQRKSSAQLKQIQEQKGSPTMEASKQGSDSTDSTETSKKGSLPSFKTYKDFAQWLHEDFSNFHAGVGCDSCGICPIVGDRYKCIDCKEKMGFDLCGVLIPVPRFVASLISSILQNTGCTRSKYSYLFPAASENDL